MIVYDTTRLGMIEIRTAVKEILQNKALQLKEHEDITVLSVKEDKTTGLLLEYIVSVKKEITVSRGEIIKYYDSN